MIEDMGDAHEDLLLQDTLPSDRPDALATGLAVPENSSLLVDKNLQ